MSSKITLQSSFLNRLKSDIERISLEKGNLSENYITSMIREIESEFEVAKDRHNKIIVCTTADATRYNDEDVFGQLRSNFHKLWAALADELPKASTKLEELSMQSTMMHSSLKENEVKIPTVELPHFNGRYEDWRNYINLFDVLIHTNTSLESIHKLKYFWTTLEGDALDIIKHLPLNGSSYSIARELLKKRFEHKRKLVNNYLNRLFKAPVIQNESSNSIKQVINTINDCTNSLKQLDLSIPDYVIIYNIVDILPIETVKDWEKSLGASIDLPQLEQFMDFLETKFRTLESTEAVNENHLKQQKTFCVQSVENDNNKNLLSAENEEHGNLLNVHTNSRSNITSNHQQKIFRKSNSSCLICKKDHFFFKCTDYLQMPQHARFNFVKRSNLCINCLSNDHMIKECKSKFVCRVCSRKHHTTLHRFDISSNNSQSSNKTNLSSAPTSQSSLSDSTSANRNFHVQSSSKLLGTARIKVVNLYGCSNFERALVDPCSTDNYITSSTANKLKLQKYFAPTEVLTMGNNEPSKCSHRVNFRIESLQGKFTMEISAAIVDNITTNMPETELPWNNFGSLVQLPLSDPFFNRPLPINILLGVDVHALIKLDKSERYGKLIAENTLLGYLIRGSAEENIYNRQRSTVFLTKSMTHDLHQQIQKFWETEETSEVRPNDPEEDLCEQIFQNTLKRGSDGRLSVDLPFQNNIAPLIGSSHLIASRRFLTLERKLESNPHLKAEYHKQINDYISSNHLIKADNTSEPGKEFYLPHHAVIKETSSTTKLRIVFDASCKSSDGTSLNDHLMIGPKLQTDIRDILFLWRQFPYPLTADVEKMYRMFGVNQIHHDYQRIVWRFSPNEPLQSYKLTTITFGTSSAPYQAIRLLNYIADQCETTHPLASKVIKNHFYVDDCIAGGYSIDETIALKNQLLEILYKYGLNLRKFNSNCNEILSNISPRLLDSNREIMFDDTQFSKTLGVCWSKYQDSFLFYIDLSNYTPNKLTKREILSLIARLYDPLGFVSPCTMLSKQIMQRIWLTPSDWDDLVDDEIQSDFTKILNELHLLRQVQIPRWINLADSQSDVTLFGFCDASIKGYGAVIYLLNPNPVNPTQKFILLSSKTKVADLKYVSIARMELNGAVMLSELLNWALVLLKPRNCNIYAFCDSQIVLSWLQSNPTKWKTYVASRVDKILKLISRDKWFYVNTKDNPADFASRGLLPSEILNNSLWWYGPQMQHLRFDNELTLNPDEEKLVKESVNQKNSSFHIQSNNLHFLSKFSDHGKMRRRVQFISKFPLVILRKLIAKLTSSTADNVNSSKNVMSDSQSKSVKLTSTANIDNASKSLRENALTTNTVTEKVSRYKKIILRLEDPFNIILRLVQSTTFSEDIKCISNDLSLPKKSKLKELFPFLDKFGVLRVGGRLQHSDLSYEQKHPIILPNNHQVTTNILDQVHRITMHGNEREMLGYLRNRYHIPRMSEKVKFHIHNCMTCYTFAKHQQQQLMGSLPSPRVQLERAFLNSGVDYAGPITIKAYPGRCKIFRKGYIALFVCMGSKALHLEVVSDLSTNAFIAAFKRFVNRRGRCHNLYSDNGKNFVGAARTLAADIRKAEKSWKTELDYELESMGTKWHFIPPATPHFGGLWEAGVKSVKTHLTKTVGKSILTFEELSTVLLQIEGVLNSRPLCAMSDNPNDFNVLTPAHFIIGEPIIAPPEEAFNTHKNSPTDRWKHVQFTCQKFLNLWKKDYLQTLQKRPKHHRKERNLCVNDLVLLTEDNIPSTLWPKAIIVEVHPGTDGHVRVATIRTANGKLYKRPITKLRYLPCNKFFNLPSNFAL